MMKIEEEHFVVRCKCLACGDINAHEVVTVRGAEISPGSVDFAALVCKDCRKMTATYPIPWPLGLPEVSRQVAEELVQELQEYIDVNC